MRTITLEGLHVLAQVGVLAHEFGAPQPVLISVSVDMPDAPAVPLRDELSQVLDYRHLRELAKAEAEREHTHLLETLAGRIAQRALALPQVAAARVRVAKPQVFADCDSVSVEVRLQPDARGTS
ncbi:MAG: dihydroneopterin aldolase [Ideonella sp.]|nr:MAG: dihydroneopterin aldolase [Burkholderiaceae bacterium]MBE7426133.1 dihydroneopterin aldolase [Ideonella sp.]